MRLPAITLSLRVRGAAPVDVAWRRYAELDRWPSWSPQVRDVEAASRLLVPGLQGRVVGPVGLRVPFTVLDVGARSWTWEVRPPIGAPVRLVHGVTGDVGGCTATLVMQGLAPLVLGYAPFARLALRRLVRP